jgi:hypothetical protein
VRCVMLLRCRPFIMMYHVCVLSCAVRGLLDEVQYAVEMSSIHIMLMACCRCRTLVHSMVLFIGLAPTVNEALTLNSAGLRALHCVHVTHSQLAYPQTKCLDFVMVVGHYPTQQCMMLCPGMLSDRLKSQLSNRC